MLSVARHRVYWHLPSASQREILKHVMQGGKSPKESTTHRVKSLTRYHRDMYTYSVTTDVKIKEASNKASICTGFAPSALPEVLVPVKAENSHTGVSTWNVYIASKPRVQKEVDVLHRYALRITYDREKRHTTHMAAQGVVAFYPITDVVKLKKVNSNLLLNHVNNVMCRVHLF